MKVLKALIESLNDDAPVRQVCCGARWNAVVSRTCGLASALPPTCPGTEETIEASRSEPDWTGCTARELAAWACSENVPEASLGLAAINSLVPVDEGHCVSLNAGEMLAQMGRGRKVAVIGHFPFTPRLAEITAKLWVLELRPRPGDLPADYAAQVLPQADVVAISSTTLLNHTLENILALCRPDSFKLLLGPTTPLSPLLFDFGLEALSGAVVANVPGALQAVRAGLNFPQIKRHCRLVTMRKPGSPIFP